ncbi:MAG: tetratricopeptide repeat protein [Planctomycetales bacterium]|nr:tetratricopeptide repeat protein [Planctomycetales bacterium]
MREESRPGAQERSGVGAPGTSAGGGTSGRPAFLTDFGLAKSVATGSKLTRTGEALGTPAYMSPEQARGEVSSLGPATDVWSLGCVLYEMLAGRAAFEGETAAAVVGRVLLEEPPRLGTLAPGTPRGLERVVRAATAKRTDERFGDGSAVRDDLDRLLAGQEPRVRVPGNRQRAIARAALGAGIAAAVGAAAVVAGTSRTPTAAPPGTAAPPSGADLAVSRARALRQTDPGEAARLLRVAVEREPERSDLRLELGLLLWALGEWPRARAAWEAIPRAAPEHSRARLYLGLESFFRFEGGALNAARGGLPDLEVAAGSDSPVAAIARGARAAVRESWPEARGELRNVAGWESALVRAYVESADPSGDPAEAVREYGIALEGGIPFAWVYNNRACIRSRLGDEAGAVGDLTAALSILPNYPEALNNRAGSRRALGDSRGAAEDYEAALLQKPGLPEALYGRGNLRQDAGDLAGAIQDFSAALHSRPQYLEALHNRGLARQALGDLEGAISDFSEVLRADPRAVHSLHGRGVSLTDRGDLAAALDDLSAALELRSDVPEVWISRGLARDRGGDFKGAIEDYGRALRLRPRDSVALNNRGWSRRSLGDLRGAAEDFAAALESDPGLDQARRNLEAVRRALSGLPTTPTPPPRR